MADIARTIFNKTYDLLEAERVGGSMTLVYVQNIFKGAPQEIPVGGMPAITIEPESDEEQTISAGKPLRVRKTQRYIIVCEISDINIDGQIVGSGGQKGILDFVADVKDILSAEGARDLGLAAEGVLNVKFPTTEYFIGDSEFPVRGASITMEIDATVTNTDR